MTSYIQRLPAVFQTVTEKQFFDATFDQVFSKKDSDMLAGYIGRRNPGSYNPINDFYLPEPTKDRTWWQLEATAFARDADTTKTNVFFYEDLLDRINYYGGNTLNQDRLFESEYYSFGPPIDYDMFINYQNYYWVDQGLTPITITGVMGSDIIGQATYTTPITATPPNLTLSTGMVIILADDPLYFQAHTVENRGGCDGIQLVPQFPDFTAGTIFENLPWDDFTTLSTGRVIQNSFWDENSWDTETQPGSGDYITIERGSIDRNAWSRTNKWYHIATINATIAATGTSFPSNATRALRPIIQFIENLTLYKSGTQFRDEIQYGFRDASANSPILLIEVQNQPLLTINATYNTTITDGTLVVFMNDDTPLTADYFPWASSPWVSESWDSGIMEAVNKYIFIANVQPDGRVIFSPKTSYATPVLEGDIVFIDEDAPYDGALRGQTWYFSNDVWQEAFNDKISVNQPPLFQLYDHNGVTLDDAVTYPGSTFEGSPIFSYKVNTTPGATSDPVLGFPIVYTSLGQASDIVFQNNLITTRYTYGKFIPIDGYYYYKTSISPILYNNWNLYDLCDCPSIIPAPPCNCIEVSKQRVIDQYVVGYGTLYQFALSVTPYGYPATATQTPDIIVSVNTTEVGPATSQADGYTFVTINGILYVDLTTYLTNLFLTTQSIAPVVELQTYTHGLLDPAATGYYQIPQQLEANPSQLEVGEISGSDLIQQFSSIISNQIGFTGVAFGGTNNYRDSRKNRSVGSYILQNLAPALKSMLVSSSDDLDFIQGLRFSQDEYTKFKNKYLSTGLQLINQEFDPVQYQTNAVVITAWVDQILKIVNISKEFSNAFAYSYMVASGVPTFSETHVTPVGGAETLTNYIDLADPRNVMYVYDVTNPALPLMLLIGQDYTITSTNLAIDVQLAPAFVGKTLTFYLYQNPLPTYIPSTPSKLGTYSTFLPRIELDATYVVPTNVIIGHDGSKTIAFNDYRDALLLELERRIYNGIQAKFRNEYYVPLREESVQSGFFRQTRYSRDEFLAITESYLNKWSAKNRANYRVNDWPTASLTTPVNELWKLYNYRDAVNSLAQPLNLPGNWKGIFQYYYDTYYPDTRPWAMLGFSEQPSWWVSEYGAPLTNLAGQKVWGSSANGLHNLYADLEAGIIRQGPSAIYDPITLQPQPQPMWERPGLSTVLPVDAAGEIHPVTTIFPVALSGNPYEPFDHFDMDWIYGDGAPVEQAWLSTSAYAFSVQEFLYLMRPGPFGELLWDTLGTELSPGMLSDATALPGIELPVMSDINWQYVQNDTYTSTDPFFAWMRPKNKDQVVHAEIVDSVTEIRFGYQVWISDRILFLGKDVASTFGQKVRTLDVNLANKFAGFTNKDTTNTYIESVTPGATTNTLIIPSTNFDVQLHTSPPVNTYSYSGVIIRALADGTFVVYGYDLLTATFVTLDRSTAQLINVSVGGTPAEFLYFTPGATYNIGDIVRYNGVYYQSLVIQTVSTFVAANWQKLRALPVTGGVSVTYKPNSLTTTTTVPYGTIFQTPQEVFDFMIGLGAYQASQGWQFQDVSPDTNMVSDWLASAKQFLFWLNTSWAPDAAIQLSPLANSASVIVGRGYPDDVEVMSNGTYSILDKFGVAIAPNNTTVERAASAITVSPSNLATGGIFFLQVTASETEHILIFDNTTSFNDIVYSPLLRARQQRLRFNGFRTNGWYGKMEAPGYLIIDSQLVPNYDTIVDSMRYFYDPDVTIDNPSLEDLGRHLIGYESKSYLDNLQVSNDIQYLFYQGAIRQKGTKQAFDKLFRSTKIQVNEIIEVFEEWALKLGNFGNTIEQVSTEFVLKPEQNTGEVIVAKLNFVPSTVGFVREIDILNAENTYTTVPKIVIGAPTAGTPTDRQATAYAILGSDNTISRVDIIDAGYGYLSAPAITINSGIQPHNLDVLYSVWQGEIIKDTTLDNIVNIDIDQPDVWTVRPIDPTYSLEFPTTKNIVYPTPNAGYVNFNDVTFSEFDAPTATVNWGDTDFNPVEGNTIWIANTFTQDWDVYKLVNPNQTFDVWADGNNDLFLRTLQSDAIIAPQFSTTGNVTDFGNLVSLQVIEAHAVVSAVDGNGTITEITLTKAGAGYFTVPLITNITGGTGAVVTATIAGGQVSGFTIQPSVGTGYTVGDVVTIAPPPSVDGATNYALAFTYDSVQTTSAADGMFYYNLVTLEGNPISATDIPDYANFTKLMLFKTMRFLTTPTLPSDAVYVANGDKIWVDQVGTSPNILWNVFTYNGSALTAFRIQEPLIHSSLFQSASVFNDAGNELVQLPVYDPFKNILPGPARQNITYMTLQDPASYNVTNDPTLFSENITFGVRQIGQLWWDLSNTRYVYYEQPMALDGSETETDNLIYRRNYWGQLFPGSVVTIYEWVQSPVPPSLYTGTGTPKDVNTYVQLTTSNRFTSATEVNYYFWVLNTTDQPNIENRTMAALDVARLLQSPKSQGFAFFSPIQQTSTNNAYMFYNVQEILAYQGDNVQVQYRVAERDDQKHAQWSFFREGDSNSLVTDQFWDKMVDSLCAYTKVLPNSPEFVDGIPVTGGLILPVPDPTLGPIESYGVLYRPRQGMFFNLPAARKVFVQAGNTLLQYIPIRDTNPSWNAGVVTDIYWSYTNWYAVGFENVTPTVIYNTLAEANAAMLSGLLTVGQIVQVTQGTIDGRYILYVVVQPNPNVSTLSLTQVGIQDSAIKLLDTIYTVTNKYSLSTELRELLNAFRTEVMVDNFIVDQNELFFSMLNFVVSEQKNPDWVFKSSYIYIKENNLPLSQDQLYIPDQITNIIDYIVDSKPYHVQIRDYTSAYVTTDVAAGTATDSMKSKFILQFGPNYSANYFVNTPLINLNAQIGYDLDQGEFTEPWDTADDTILSHYWDSYDFPPSIGLPPTMITNVLNQFVSGNPVPADFDPGPGNPWPNIYTVPLTFFDASKKGYSSLFPYTFTFDALDVNIPSSFVTPQNIVGVQIGTQILNIGIDYYVEFNNDNTPTSEGTYTIYFYNDPGTSPVPVALVWWDGGSILQMDGVVPNAETANGFATDDMVINVDTRLPADVSTGVPTPYVLYGDVWDEIEGPVADALVAAGGSPFIAWDITPVLDVLPNTISSKENTNIPDGALYYRNAAQFSGTLVNALLAPTVPTNNLDVVTVSATTDVFPVPAAGESVGVWINGERIEYRLKELVSPGVWALKLILRGSNETGAVSHVVGATVFVETNNIMPPGSDTDVWNASSLPASPDVSTQQAPNVYTSIVDVPAGGLWYSQTPEAVYLQAHQGISIP